MWQALVLGTAQDGGVPHFGCYRPCCQRARQDARLRRLVACLGLVNTTTGQVLLIDATPDIREQADRLRLQYPPLPGLGEGPGVRAHHSPPPTLGEGPGVGAHHPPPPDLGEGPGVGAPINAIFLTHAHIGHYTGLIQLGKEVLNSRDLPVYCTARMAAFLSRNGPWDGLVRGRNVDLRPLNPGETISPAPGLSLEAIAVPHRAEYTDTVAFRISGPERTLLYLPDIDAWDRWERDLTEEIRAVDYALLDGTFYSAEELPWRDLASVGHPLITETMERLGDRRPGSGAQVYFTHLNHTNPVLDVERAACRHVEARGYHIAGEGLVLPL